MSATRGVVVRTIFRHDTIERDEIIHNNIASFYLQITSALHALLLMCSKRDIEQASTRYKGTYDGLDLSTGTGHCLRRIVVTPIPDKPVDLGNGTWLT